MLLYIMSKFLSCYAFFFENVYFIKYIMLTFCLLLSMICIYQVLFSIFWRYLTNIAGELLAKNHRANKKLFEFQEKCLNYFRVKKLKKLNLLSSICLLNWMMSGSILLELFKINLHSPVWKISVLDPASFIV